MIQSPFWKFVIGCLAVLAMAAFVLVTQALRVPAAYQTPTVPSLGEAREAETAVKSLAEELSARPTGSQRSRREFSHRLTEKQLNDYLASHPDLLGSVKAESVVLDLLPGGLQISAVVPYQGRRLLLQASGTVTLRDGRALQFLPSELKLGALPLVGPLREQAVNKITQALAGIRLPERVHVRSVELTDEAVMVYGDRYGE